jgi:tRNA(Ile)-lysidine synthase
MADRSLSARVADFVARHKLLPRGAVVVVGVSGGADSIALLHGLRALGRDHDHPLRLHVAHLHHGIRGADADADAAFVESLAADLGLPCIRDHVDIPKLHAREPGSREELARRERYRFFERAAARCGADHIAVGHHADDQAETVLHRIVRGTGLRGLAGMAPVRTLRGVEGCRLVRPLLCVTRKEILAYLESGGMAYRTDATNADRDLTRNRIRGELLPELARDYNPRVRAALVRLAEQAGGAYAFIDATAIKTLAAVIVRADEGAIVLNADALARKDRMVQAEVIRRALGRFECGEQRLAFAHLDAVVTLMAERVDGGAVSLPYGITARLMGSQLVFSVEATTPPAPVDCVVPIRLPGTTSAEPWGCAVTCTVQERRGPIAALIREARAAVGHWEYMDRDRVVPPLVLRGRRAGDRYQPVGAPGSKALADVLADAKVPVGERGRAAVLCDRDGPIWLIGQRLGERVKLTPATRTVLRVEVRESDDPAR